MFKVFMASATMTPYC